MGKVAVIIDRNFDGGSLRRLTDGLRGAGHEVVAVGLRRGAIMEGRHHTGQVTVEAGTREILPDQLEGVVIPSGYTPEQLMRHHEELLNVVRDAYARGKPVGTVSRTGWLLFEPDPTRGSQLVSWPEVKRDLLSANGRWRQVDLAAHDRIRFAHTPDDVDGFCRAFDGALGGPGHAYDSIP